MQIKYKILFIIIMYILAIMGSLNYNQLQAGEDVVVIIHSSRSSLNRLQLKRIFTGISQTWPDGTPVKVLLNSNKAVFESFARRYLELSADEVDRAWVRQNVKNGVPKPRKVPGVVIKAMVSKSTVFIGFVKKSVVTATGVKIID